MEMLSQYVERRKYMCKCCGLIKPEGIEKIIEDYDYFQSILFGVYDLVAEIWKVEMTSGYRCEKYNAKVGGAKYSPHIYGLAIDFKPKNMDDRGKIIEYLRRFSNFIRIGHKKYEKDKKHIHIDVMVRVADVLYSKKVIPNEVYQAYKFIKEW